MSAIPPSVCILLPVHNGSRYVDEAIASVCSQSIGGWELLAIDDASTDDSIEQLRRHADPRIRIERNAQNLGLYGTLREAIRNVQAEWVVILMQDDRLKPGYLESMLALAGQHPSADAFWATEDLIGADGLLVSLGRDTGRVEPIAPGTASWCSALTRGCIWTISGSMTRARLFREYPLRADLPHCGDYEWFLRVVRDRPFVYYERALVDLRVHAGQTSALHLSTARDVQEGYAIVRNQLSSHPHDLNWRSALVIIWRRMLSTARRVPGSVRRQQWQLTTRLMRYVMSFFALGFAFGFWRRKQRA